MGRMKEEGRKREGEEERERGREGEGEGETYIRERESVYTRNQKIEIVRLKN